MNNKQMALLLGGLLPAVLLGLTGIFQKLSGKAGIAAGPFLIGVGLTSALVGAVFILAEKDGAWTRNGALWTVCFGLVWAVSIGFISIALRRYGGQITQLVPLFNMNTLVAVLLGLVVFGEWRTVNVPRLVCAAVLIIAGGVLASKS